MSDFEAKTHQVPFQLGLCPRPRWGSWLMIFTFVFV